MSSQRLSCSLLVANNQSNTSKYRVKPDWTGQILILTVLTVSNQKLSNSVIL